jgi:4-hydroxythreonine-4-phosphate dehydrogenase
MRIFFLSRHLSLIKACQFVTFENVLPFIENCHEAMKMLGMPEARLAVAALNPHGGERGLCGEEEMNALEPAVKVAKERGINAFGPIPADSIFRLFDMGKCDAVLSLYHDQGHIAAKVHDLPHTVSVTVGLPFIRTSVDHGTAFDIAGKGIASSTSMEESIKVTALYAQQIALRKAVTG